MQKLQLTIPEPCHENWQQMTPTEQGRFCNACAKEVIDFSMMTDTEVLNYFTSLTHDKVCGRALPSQLERTISKPKDPKKKLFWYWNYIVMFFMFFGKGNGAKAQGNTQVVTAADLNKIGTTNINNALAGKVGEVAVSNKRIITGKVTDKDGNPVSFASVKIKGFSAGVSADANGAYSLKVNANAMLVISGASFKDAEVPVGLQSNLNTVLERDADAKLKEVVVTIAGGVMRRPVHKTMTASKDTKGIIKSRVIFELKDDNNSSIINNAVITITRKRDNFSDKILSDNQGIYKFTEIRVNESYFIKVEAAGYEPNEFTIEAKDIKDREKAWQVLLRRQKPEVVRSTATPKMGVETTVRLGQVSANVFKGDTLYVVDGIIIRPGSVDINPDDVEDVTVLQAPQAIAIYGSQASYGAIVITTRKAKEISLNEVVVNSGGLITCSTTAGGISYTNIYEDSFLGDTIATVKTLITDSIKVYPNPVQRNTGFSVALKLKQAGNYSLQVTDASGRILLLQKFNTGSKNHTEKVLSDSRWAGGIYYIRVFDAQNKLVSKSSFIVQ
jgi:TonB-dependent SusC/RagA subfamily outer membrane receptor